MDGNRPGATSVFEKDAPAIHLRWLCLTLFPFACHDQVFAKERFVRFGRFQGLLFVGEPSEAFCADVVASEDNDCPALIEAYMKKKALKLVEGGSVIVRYVAAFFLNSPSLLGLLLVPLKISFLIGTKSQNGRRAHGFGCRFVLRARGREPNVGS